MGLYVSYALDVSMMIDALAKTDVARLRVIEVPITGRYTEYSMAKGQSGLQAVRILFDYLIRR